MSDASVAEAPAKTKRKYTRRAPDVMQSPRRETHSGDFQIGQHSTITDDTPREDVGREKYDPKMFGTRLSYSGELIFLESEDKKIEVTPAYLAELAFNEEPLTIIINPSAHKNAASIFEQWNNGRGAEMLVHGRWQIVTNLPVGQSITVKRKVVEQIIRARVMNVQTVHENATVDSPRNEIRRSSSAVHSFSILRDDNPRASEWLEMCYARPI